MIHSCMISGTYIYFRYSFYFLILGVWVNLASVSPVMSQTTLWKGEDGSVTFLSEAPLENITAQSRDLKGVIDINSRSFAFSIDISGFVGFNSDLQRTHFLENYMEEKKFPTATFTGKIIEDISFDEPGVYPVRAKGQLNIHGIARERIIRGTITIGESSMLVQSSFQVPLADHGIRIPKLVSQKIAEEIKVVLDITLTPDKRP